jgi:hypothetical protein
VAEALTAHDILIAELVGTARGMRMLGRTEGAEYVERAVERLEALEEIRQRVVDGWLAERRPVARWLRPIGNGFDIDPDPIGPEVASLLWPEG